MRFAVRLKNFSVGLAFISSISVAAASAQSLLGVNAQLDHNLDSKTAAAGQVVTAKLDGTVTTADGLRLPKGSELIGKVDTVQRSENGGPSSVSLLFSSAKLKDGKTVPVKVTVVAAYPSSAGDSSDASDQTLPPPPAQVNGDAAVQQDAGALGKVALTSAVKNSDSGTFSRANGDFRLFSGTYLQVGIAPSAAAGTSTAAE
jgi:hypothetical protein